MINREFSGFIKNLMPRVQKKVDLDSPVSMWREMDRLGGFPEKTTVVIFRTTGCSWYNFSSCSMCGYFNDISPDVGIENLYHQIDRVVSSLDTEALKVFTSGSFLDPLEFPLSAREYFFSSIKGKVERLLVESRTEYIRKSNLEDLPLDAMKVRVAIGLESASDSIITNSINKGSSFSKYVAAAEILKDLGVELRTYLLFKPPFLSEKQAIDDMLYSIKKAQPYSKDVSVNPMNIQSNTYVEYLWKRGLYKLPRLWSLARILIESENSGVDVVSYPTGGNKERGVHNDNPDPQLLQLIYESSLNQNFEDLKNYYAESDRSLYERTIELESLNLLQADYDKMIRKDGSFIIN